MTTKLKLISISIALFLIAALSVALVFALPKEEFNLSGSLSYEPSYQGYEVCKSFRDPEGNSYVRVYEDGRAEAQLSISYLEALGLPANVNQKYEGIISGGMLLATSGEGGVESIFSGETFPGSVEMTDVSTVLSTELYFVNENFIYGGYRDTYFIKEGLDPEEIVFVGYPETNAISGYDLALPIQTSNLEGDSLKNALVGGGASRNGRIYVFNGYIGERVALANITFGTFDQTTGGIKTVEISLANQTLTEEIKILVYEDEEEIAHYQISGADGTSEFEIPPMPAGTTVEDLVSVCNAQTTKLRYEKYYLADLLDDSGSENIETITADMISDFKIEGERGSFKLTYKQAEVYLQFEVYQEGQYKTNADQTMAYLAMIMWDSAQTGVDPLSSLSAYLVSDESVTFERADLVVEYFVDGALTTFDEIISTGGVKNYQIRVSLQNGTLVEEVDMSTFVYNSQNRLPTGFINVGFNSGSIPLLEDGSLDLEGKYIRVCYNRNFVQVGQEAGFTEGVDYEDIYLTDERVNLVYYIGNGAMRIRAVYITFDLGGQTFDSLVWTAFR